MTNQNKKTKKNKLNFKIKKNKSGSKKNNNIKKIDWQKNGLQKQTTKKL
jgi:hypothetical protein